MKIILECFRCFEGSFRYSFTISVNFISIANLVILFKKQALQFFHQNMSRVMRKPDFCICENKDADQLSGNREADLRLWFRYTDSTIPLLPIYEISSLYPSSVTVQTGLCRTSSETPKTGFLTTRLIYKLQKSSSLTK